MAITVLTTLEINPDSRYTPLTHVLISDIPQGQVKDETGKHILSWKRDDEWALYTYIELISPPGAKKLYIEEYSSGAWAVYSYGTDGKLTGKEDNLGWYSNIPRIGLKDEKLKKLFAGEMYYNGQDRIFFRVAPGILYCPKTDYYDCRGSMGVKKDVIKRMPYTSRFLETFDPKEIISLYRKEKGN